MDRRSSSGIGDNRARAVFDRRFGKQVIHRPFERKRHERSAEEFVAGHIAGAVSVPVAELKRRLREIPKSREVVAYCRGRYCVYSLEAVTILRKHGYRARRAEEGLPDWKAAGLPVEVGA